MYVAIAAVTGAEATGQFDEKGVPNYQVTDMLLKGEDEFTVDKPRVLFKELRDRDLLSEYSKGKVAVRDFGDYVTIIEKNSGRPAFILLNTPAPGNRDNLPVYHKSFAKMVNESLLETARELDIDVSGINHGSEDFDAEYDEDDDIG